MATTYEISSSVTIPTRSYDTALCVIPPSTDCGNIDRLRELYDKAYGSWPAHINLVYPFVTPESLPRAQQQIQAQFDRNQDAKETQTVTLGDPGLFKHRSNSTIFLQDAQPDSTSCLTALRSMALRALGQKAPASNLHLTVGQTTDNTLFSQQFLLGKARLLPTSRFRVGALAILIRENASTSDSVHPMRLWGLIDLARSEDVWVPRIPEHWINQLSQGPSTTPMAERDDIKTTLTDQPTFSREIQSGPTYRYDPEEGRWLTCMGADSTSEKPPTVTVSSYNVLIDSEYPPARDRDPHLIRTILSDSACADILVLQEVSDDFLSFLLKDREVQRQFPNTSHGPPDQSDVPPLPSLRNVVILSRWYFDWRFVPFHRRHKGALVAKFSNFATESSCGCQGFVVAGVHLTSGLTDGSVAAKSVQFQNLASHLTRHHSADPWIIAGDFNLTTSTHTINTALKDNSISGQTVAALSSIEVAMSDCGLIDAWFSAHVEAADVLVPNIHDSLFEGEEGATFDPRNNVLAAATSGTSNHRPQRYDRILLRSQDVLHVSAFNHFGLPEDIEGVQVVPSDHYGVRATLSMLENLAESNALHNNVKPQPAVKLIRATPVLADTLQLETVLSTHRMFPDAEEIQQRQQAFAILKQTILGSSDDHDATLSDIPMVVVPVGSYALGVWTSDSDIDCLCVGTISSKTFFKLARQRLVKAEGRGVRIMRKVEASTGTMLELSVNGVAMDLQYCPAARVVERWSEFPSLLPADPIFNMSILSLRKLKPYRDMLYIQRTLPSMSTFRLAYRCIKLWAVQCGVYSAKVGFLGGVHITLMLSWVSKSIAHDCGSSGAADLVASFFSHFAQFDWINDMMYDAFFHRKLPRYHRSAREPMVILGYHAPNSNIAHTSTVPGLQTLIREAKTAAELLSDPSMTWEQFFGGLNVPHVATDLGIGASRFLQAHTSYVKIDIQFWGRTLAKGKSLVGWVESRCVSLVVDIHKALPGLEVRIWPARFTDSEVDSDGTDYHGCYLLGLTRPTGTVTPNTYDDKLVAKHTLNKVLDRFLTQLRTDEKNYDAGTCWVDISLSGPKDVKYMRLDGREWGDYVPDLEPDSDDEEDEEDLSDELPNPIRRTIPQRHKPTATPVSSSKLRPASDVLHRLRWDPALDPADYIVGYEDRFLGAKETSLEKWKTEQTDEEFIPQHRILYFKRRGGDNGNGELVWERATRIDKVFGSGTGSGEAKSQDVPS